MSDKHQRTLERSATSPEELAHLYETRWRSGEWVERQIEAGPCPDRGIHAGRRQGRGGEAGLFTVHASDGMGYAHRQPELCAPIVRKWLGRLAAEPQEQPS